MKSTHRLAKKIRRILEREKKRAELQLKCDERNIARGIEKVKSALAKLKARREAARAALLKKKGAVKRLSARVSELAEVKSLKEEFHKKSTESYSTISSDLEKLEKEIKQSFKDTLGLAPKVREYGCESKALSKKLSSIGAYLQVAGKKLKQAPSRLASIDADGADLAGRKSAMEAELGRLAIDREGMLQLQKELIKQYSELPKRLRLIKKDLKQNYAGEKKIRPVFLKLRSSCKNLVSERAAVAKRKKILEKEVRTLRRLLGAVKKNYRDKVRRLDSARDNLKKARVLLAVRKARIEDIRERKFELPKTIKALEKNIPVLMKRIEVGKAKLSKADENYKLSLAVYKRLYGGEKKLTRQMELLNKSLRNDKSEEQELRKTQVNTATKS